MKRDRIILLITTILAILIIAAYLIFTQGIKEINELQIGIFVLIIAFAIIAFVRALKKDKEAKEGQPSDDELSNQLKYKAGYYSFMASMYMWLFIFLFKEHFPDVETMIGGGILLMGLIAFISKLVVRKEIS